MPTKLSTILSQIISNDARHAKWLNSLSYMENCGAKKIARCQHPFLVTEVILKHAAEEARHGHYLKKQIRKITEEPFPTYENEFLLAPKSTQNYINHLDVQICKYLRRELKYQNDALKYAAYLLVTYAIEVRAEELYPVYQNLLTKQNSKVQVKSIIVEEKEHLNEISTAMEQFFSNPAKVKAQVRQMEEKIYGTWMEELEVLLEKEDSAETVFCLDQRCRE